jgi:hypothetical protein
MSIYLSIFVAFTLRSMVSTPTSYTRDLFGPKASSAVTKFVGSFPQSLYEVWDNGIKVGHGSFHPHNSQFKISIHPHNRYFLTYIFERVSLNEVGNKLRNALPFLVLQNTSVASFIPNFGILDRKLPFITNVHRAVYAHEHNCSGIYQRTCYC